MIYKFKTQKQGSNIELEVLQLKKELELSIESDEVIMKIYLSKDDLYNLIGALHTIQSKIKKGVEDGLL